ncbi:hypothetical protein K443DRAFT_402791 [Laccaria amethystina LaAM-08-1]|uniref:Uncharacterized protein n=1 Tax=Laccaria amethystina LaAM-08-1 TaxID=1095629 RepID=A0A0C9WWY5_9AGAR|nr:hypothetical protein K443DRAFT_402791 [Laccaria amethystina LaAM-08-1]
MEGFEGTFIICAQNSRECLFFIESMIWHVSSSARLQVHLQIQVIYFIPQLIRKVASHTVVMLTMTEESHAFSAFLYLVSFGPRFTLARANLTAPDVLERRGSRSLKGNVEHLYTTDPLMVLTPCIA